MSVIDSSRISRAWALKSITAGVAIKEDAIAYDGKSVIASITTQNNTNKNTERHKLFLE